MYPSGLRRCLRVSAEGLPRRMDQDAVRDFAHGDLQLIIILRQVDHTGSPGPVLLTGCLRISSLGLPFHVLGDDGPNVDRGSPFMRELVGPGSVVYHAVVLHYGATSDEHLSVVDVTRGPRHNEYRAYAPPDEHVAEAVNCDAGFLAYGFRICLRYRP